MHPAKIARRRPDAQAHVMASSGESLGHGELDARSNRPAHFLRARGVRRDGPLVIVMENRIEWPVVVAAGMRTGLYVTPVNRHLTVTELMAPPAEAPGGNAPGSVVASAAVAEVLGRLDEEGFLYLSGGESHTIISGGVNIHPVEIEDVLTAHPRVLDAAVIGTPGPEFGEKVTAVVEAAGGRRVSRRPRRCRSSSGSPACRRASSARTPCGR
ncbi:AMP-binding protein [Thermomonospora curvata]|uniref:Acyl-CoA synthetase (AMP-forming)/AMP-acid ligase II-like protein n=1 Tax=Thermomonospora curvata (strain ATCC 19995 / DSM 43183 / JCM 3096 / KCTC 9072 / NBRC 15933 / NCIMB 10081 / Henssen B9) TaxID=471852 RepID=D1A4V9_THECD|nr:AMP-binding protein [Thermomonospora curvata]ACY98128.1 Acyl-CoA synthetase (AMP-forming)/AMP-acid ligase II-like protein [Thermomonospora curvata DSM 43183]